MGRMLGTGGFTAGPPEGRRADGSTRRRTGTRSSASYAMAAQRHMHEFGTTSEQLAEIAVGVREFAPAQPERDVPRPDHRRRRPGLADDRRPAAQARLLRDLRRRRRVHHDDRGAGEGPAAAAGLRARRRRRADALEHQPDARLHHVPRGAIGRADRVRAGPASPPPTSTRSSSTTASRSPCCSCSRTSGSARRARAGRSCRRATSRRGGELPLNTDGGGLSSCHPGMRGIFLIIEAVRQLRGQAGEAQVPDCEVRARVRVGRVAVVHRRRRAREGAPVSESAIETEHEWTRPLPTPDSGVRAVLGGGGAGRAARPGVPGVREPPVLPAGRVHAVRGRSRVVDAARGRARSTRSRSSARTTPSRSATSCPTWSRWSSSTRAHA